MQRIFLLLISALLSIGLSAQSTSPSNGAPVIDHSLYILKGSTVHVSPEVSMSHADVWIRDGKIVKVTSAESLPAEAIIVDCKGKVIYASFIDLYSDYGQPAVVAKKKERRPQMERSDKGPFAWNEAIQPEYSAVAQFQIKANEAEKLRALGFGAVLSAQQDGIIRGTAALVSLRDENENKALILDQAAQMMSLDKGSSTQDYPSSRMGAIALLRQTLYDQQWYQSAGSDKEYNYSLERLTGQLQLPQIISTMEKNDILRCDRIGDEFGIQFIFIGSGDEYERAQDIRGAGGMVVLPLNYPEAYDVKDPFLARSIPLSTLRHWDQAPSNASYLDALGVDIAFTRHGLKDGKSFLPAIRKAIEHGLDPKSALRALTTNPARAMGLDGKIGLISAGAIANLIICDGDIFDTDTRILENWVQGQRHLVNAYDDTDIAAQYDLNIDGRRYHLSVKENRGKFSGRIHDESDRDTIHYKVELNVVAREVNLLFQVKEAGYYRLHGSINKRLSIWTGSGESPTGKQVDWNCIRKGDISPKLVKEKEPQEAKSSILKYPNNGYGWSEQPIAQNLIIRNATLWTNGPEGIIEDADIILMDGKILGIGHNLDLADFFKKEKDRPEFTTIDAYGKHLTSGIIDEHSHIAITGGVNESGQASSAEVRIGDVINPEDIDIYYQLAGGVTASQLLHGSANPIGGQSALIKLRWGLNAEQLKIEGADGFIKFALGENVKQSNWGDQMRVRFPQTRMGVEQVYYDHFYRAQAYDRAMRGNNIQAKDTKKKERQQLVNHSHRRDLELEALAEILNQKRFITCHSYIQSEINMLMHVADSMNFRINTFTHILEGYKVADKLMEHRAGASTFSDWWAYKYEVREATPYNAALMSQMGLTVAINSDDPEMGRRLNQEAAKGVKYGGMSEEEAWKMVTLNPAKLLHLDHRMGSLEAGKDADIVIWTANPLSIYARAEQTYIDGICYYDLARDEALGQAIAQERSRLLQRMLKSGQKGGGSRSLSIPKKHRYHCDHEGK